MPTLNSFSTTLFSRPDINGNPVSAKYLQDGNGNFIINPLSKTGEPYIVPAEYNLQAVKNPSF